MRRIAVRRMLAKGLMEAMEINYPEQQAG